MPHSMCSQGAFGVPHRPVNESDRIISLDASATDRTPQGYAAVPTQQTHAQFNPQWTATAREGN